jgi:general secretion pathway protein F
MRFEIKAYLPGDGVTSLIVEAANLEDASSSAAELGIEIVSIREVRRWIISRRADQPFNLLLFSMELRSLLEAGLSLIECLDALARKEAAAVSRRLIEALIRQLREGKSFSGALREFPLVFPPLYLALTAASEQTGDLSGALARFIDYRARMDVVRERMVSASIYPAMLLGVGGFVVLFLMTYVVPRFSRVYEDLGGDLPFMSKLLIDWGKLIGSYGWAILAALVVAGTVAFVQARRRKLTWSRLASLLLRWKVMAPVRERYRIYQLARFYRTLGLLLHGGLPVASALAMARELLDADMQFALDRVLIGVRSGVALSDAMEREHLAPQVAGDLLKIGERTGDMGDKMIRIADFYDQETSRWADRFSRLLEPVLMLIIGTFIAFIVVLLYLPIFELAGSLK